MQSQLIIEMGSESSPSPHPRRVHFPRRALSAGRGAERRFARDKCWGGWLGGASGPNARGSEKRELAEGADSVPGHGLGPSARARAAMTSLPCPHPGRDASKAIFPDIAPVPSVVAAYQVGLSPATAAASDLPTRNHEVVGSIPGLA